MAEAVVETLKRPSNELAAQKDCAGLPIRDRIVGLRRVPAKDLLPNPKNWRRHPKVQAEALRGLLSEIGYADALLARELPDGRLLLIDGHLRKATTPEAQVPVLVVDLDEAESDKLLVSLDPLSALAGSDAERFTALLATVRTDSQAVEELLRRTAGERIWQSVHPDEIGEFDASPARAEELRNKWRTEVGQHWRIGPHALVCGDATDVAVVASLWKQSELRCRLVWTDPPYGVNYASKNSYLNKADRGNRIQTPIKNDEISPQSAASLFARALLAVVPRCEAGACCYATVPSGPSLVYFIQAFVAAGFALKQLLVWVKNQFVLGMSDYHHQHEPILYGWRPDGPHCFCGDRTQGSIFEVDKPQSSSWHPTTKPVELIARMIRNSSRPGELIYDPFCGSGSTVLAAHRLGRVGYGCEIDPGYAAVCLERLSMLDLKPELVGE